MGLLIKAAALAEPNIEKLINDFNRENPSFHCAVFLINGSREKTIDDINKMSSCHGAACSFLPGRNCLVLLPGLLDLELFLHRLSNSTGSSVLFHFSANSYSFAINKLKPYL